MAIQSMQLDPNSASYTDDEIVGKVNSATTKVSADSMEDGTTNKAYTATEQTKLGTVEDSATADQDGDEMVTAIDAGSSSITRADAVDASSMDLVKTNPVAGEYKVKAIHRQSDGKMDIEYEDIAV